MRIIAICLDTGFESPSVLLPFEATEEQTEAALSNVGIYAPRGLDTLEWCDGADEVAVIRDGGGEPIVTLVEVK